jgi:hypothetical protein
MADLRRAAQAAHHRDCPAPFDDCMCLSLWQAEEAARDDRDDLDDAYDPPFRELSLLAHAAREMKRDAR